MRVGFISYATAYLSRRLLSWKVVVDKTDKSPKAVLITPGASGSLQNSSKFWVMNLLDNAAEEIRDELKKITTVT